MFIELLTAKNEKISVNLNKVLFFAETKKGTTVILEDGTGIDLCAEYATVSRRFAVHVDNGVIRPNNDKT